MSDDLANENGTITLTLTEEERDLIQELYSYADANAYRGIGNIGFVRKIEETGPALLDKLYQ